MPKLELNDEKAVDVLIFWVESSDGSISYAELEGVQRVLDDMNYSMENYHSTFSYINGLSTDNVKALVEEAIQYAKDNFSDDGKRLTVMLAEAIANCDGKIAKKEVEKIDRLKAELGV